ncbi:lipase member H-A-like [Bacillus rossius redtenbacheri]|uniref:lipase member H-A-like n=1 Tax=Bacillus rossius redtenbacheri TaxID=93214 RepID=UPI002FDCF002
MCPAASSLLPYAVLAVYLGDDRFTLTTRPKGECSHCVRLNLTEDIGFLLFTRQNPRSPHRLLAGDDARLRSSPFDLRAPTVVYIHGFSEHWAGLGASAIRDAYLERGHYNVVVVAWQTMAAGPWYARAVANCKVCGRHTATFLDYLVSRGLDLASLHVVGFSLGAEVAGYVGGFLASGRLPRVTGLDPAFPLFVLRTSRNRLSRGDADFVDVIHTDGGAFGFPGALGHADFYPNGGTAPQPGCRLAQHLASGQLQDIVSCSHQRAWKLYAESVRSECSFRATRCHHWFAHVLGLCADGDRAYMGLAASPRARGKYFLRTRDRPPFGLSEGPCEQQGPLRASPPRFGRTRSSRARSRG